MKHAGIQPKIVFRIIVSAVLSCIAGFMVSCSKGNMPDSLEWKYQYDEQGYVTAITSPGKHTTKITYHKNQDEFLKGFTIEYPDAFSATYRFDNNGLFQSMHDTIGDTRYEYDNAGRIVAVDSHGEKLTYEYDPYNRLVRESAGGGAVKYSYDFLGRVSTIFTSAGDIVYQFDANQACIFRTLPNGVTTVWKYRPDGMLESITHAASNRKIIAQYTYSYRPDLLVSEIKEYAPQGERTIRCQYDKQHRLIEADDSRTGATAWTYDLMGNRIAAEMTGGKKIMSPCDWAGRLTNYNGKQCAKDGDGNLTAYQADSGGMMFSYNGMNIVSEIVSPSGRSTYAYDGAGRLVERTAQNRKTTYVCDPFSLTWRPLLAKNSDGSTSHFIYEGDLPLGVVDGEDVKFYLQDYLGSVRLVVDNNGNVVEIKEYDPFGVPLQKNAGTELEPGFAGLFYEPHAGMYLTRARVYDPALGRFMQIDPKHRIPTGASQDLSMYAYCGGDPANWVDADGAIPKYPSMLRLYYSGIGFKGIGYLGNSFNSMPYWPDFAGGLNNANLFPPGTNWTDNYPPGTKPLNVKLKGDFQHQTEQYIDYVAKEMHIGNGDKVGIAFYGINNRFDDAWKKTQEYFSQGKKVIFLPSNSGFGKQFDIVWTLADKLRMILPSFLNPRKLDLPKLIQRVESHGAVVTALLTSSGANFVLQENVEALVKYAKANSDHLFAIGILSGAISEYAHAMTLTNAGYQVIWLGENKLVAAVERPFADYAPFGTRIGLLGVPEYFLTFFGNLFNSPLKDKDGGHCINKRTIPVDNFFGKYLGYESNYQFMQDLLKDNRIKMHFSYLRNLVLDASKPEDQFLQQKDDISGIDKDKLIATLTKSLRRYKKQWDDYPLPDNKHFLPPPGGGGGGSSLSPSPVGGVYLRGAGEALKGLGTISGIAIDKSNGRLVLLSETSDTVGLPDLRLDDLVTIFRMVYEYGEAPYVSIDPDSLNPHGPTMNIRHGKGTEGTFTGWVLFETDRIMKGYSLGVDNVTRENIRTSIAGYTNMFADKGSSFQGNVSGSTWERFWIVPAKVTRQESMTKQLTLFDVPLMLKTEPMVMKNNRLESAPGKKPSFQAQMFTAWFTKNYDRIAEEVSSTPPGAYDAVKSFKELRRIALISAIAEYLRDQGVPMPAWMKEYSVKECRFASTTPAITVKDTLRAIIRQIYGGVSLSPPDEIVTTESGSTKATSLEPLIAQALTADPASGGTEIDYNGTKLTATPLPGAETRDIGALQLALTDLRVPVLRGTEITLPRCYNSFFHPHSEFGNFWTLDLPVLEKQPRPTKRTGDKTSFRMAYHLTSPLNTWSSTFEKTGYVDALGANLMVPNEQGTFLAMADGNDKRIGVPTEAIHLRDGSVWHFYKESGLLAAKVQTPSMIIYRRDNKYGLITRIEGWYGKDLCAEIKPEYDDHGKLVRAKGSNGIEVAYSYDKENHITHVKSVGDEISYAYSDALVTDVAFNGTKTRHFEYDSRGRLKKETSPDGPAVDYTGSYEKSGAVASIVGSNDAAHAQSIEYDASFRPVRQTTNDGTRIEWRYGDAFASDMAVTTMDGRSYTQRRSVDGMKTTVEGTDGLSLNAATDNAGRVTSFSQNGNELFTQQWYRDGRLASFAAGSTTVRPQYDENGVLNKTTVYASNQGDSPRNWVETEYNEAGLAKRITDCTGAETKIGYDKAGLLQTIVSNQGGVEIGRNDKGLVKSVKTSWGDENTNDYNPQGQPKRSTFKRGESTGEVVFESGLPVKITGFDGGVEKIDYKNASDKSLEIKKITTPDGMQLKYDYDKEQRLKSVDCGETCRIAYSYDKEGRITGMKAVGKK